MKGQVLAAKLASVGITVTEAFDVRGFGARALLASGLLVRERRSDFEVALWHGPDPTSASGDVSRHLGAATSLYQLSALVKVNAPRVPALWETLDGERRDVAAVVRAQTEQIAPSAFPVVASDGPVPNALAVSMRGRRFDAFLGGTRFSAMSQVEDVVHAGWRLESPRPLDHFFSMDFDRHRLTAQALGTNSLSIRGTIRTARGDEWFSEVFERYSDFWAHSLRSSTASVGGPSMAQRFMPVIKKATRRLPQAFEQHLSAFARVEVERSVGLVDWARTKIAVASTAQDRLQWLSREREWSRRLDRAQQIARDGYIRTAPAVSAHCFPMLIA